MAGTSYIQWNDDDDETRVVLDEHASTAGTFKP